MKLPDGKSLEDFASTIEGLYLPEGFTVTTNVREYRDGIQLAEFDIQITGRLGTCDVRWLVECRDRPSDGPQGTAWIEQLIARKGQYKFDKVIAVSSTGFTAGAELIANENDVQLRAVHELDADSIAEWIRPDAMLFTERRCHLKHLGIDVAQDTSAEQIEGLRIALLNPASIRLRATGSGELVLPRDAFVRAVNLKSDEIDRRLTGDGPNAVRLGVNYVGEDRYAIDTPHGEVPIHKLTFHGTIENITTVVPIAMARRYSEPTTGGVIAESVAYEVDHPEHGCTIEVHDLKAAGHAVVTIRAKPGKD